MKLVAALHVRCIAPGFRMTRSHFVQADSHAFLPIPAASRAVAVQGSLRRTNVASSHRTHGHQPGVPDRRPRRRELDRGGRALVDH